MVTYAFDASAVLRFLDGEEGSDRVAQILLSHVQRKARLVISAIQWGEIASVTIRRRTVQSLPATLSRLAELGFEVIPISAEQAIAAALLRYSLKLPYADAFLVRLTQEQGQAILVTADFDFKVAAHLVTIEFLSAKSIGQTPP